MFFRTLTRNIRNRDNLNIQDELDGFFLTTTLFQTRLRQEKLRSERSNLPLCLVVVNLKQLLGILSKRTEKTFRRILQHFGYTIATMTRECDIKGWLSVDKIAILTPDTDESGAEVLARKIVTQLTTHFNAAVDDFQDEVRRLFTIHSLKSEHDSLPERRRAETVRSYSQSFYWLQCPSSNAGVDSNVRSLCKGNAALAIDALAFFYPLPIRFQANELKLVLKRITDIIGSVVGIALGAPLMVTIATLIKLTSPGPVIFCQQRLGFMGKPFTFLKFRSMEPNCNDSIHKTHVKKLISAGENDINQETGEKQNFKLTDDPRITPVGKILRKTSLDELPQLFNVLKGDMSLVGPRPHPIYECEQYKRWHWRRILEVKPGITGLWQVKGRLNATYDEQIRLDLAYVRTWNLWLDLKILVKTFITVISTKGAG